MEPTSTSIYYGHRILQIEEELQSLLLNFKRNHL
jgi:hypothetical protein